MSTATPPSPADSFLALEVPGADLWRARKHLIDTRDLSRSEVDCIMAAAGICQRLYELTSKPLPVLEDRIMANLFYENSTRTRSSFELAARKLGASVLNLDIRTSSVTKGESITDTARTLVAMGVHAVIQRHASAGSAQQLAEALRDRVHVINAGDGWNAHPTQALLDLYSMLIVKPDFAGSKVAIIGDITHSRVARSNLWLLKLFGADIHLAGPPTLIPAELASLGVTVHNRLEPAIEGCDFVMALRLQLERQVQGLIPSLAEYRKLYRLDHHRVRLAKPSVKVLHPGPVNRDVEITGALADDPE